MVCEHLSAVETALLDAGIPVTTRGQTWSYNCREWVYFDAWLDTRRIHAEFGLPDFIREHTHRGTHDGQEHGLVCTRCNDAVMGLLEPERGMPVFPS